MANSHTIYLYKQIGSRCFDRDSHGKPIFNEIVSLLSEADEIVISFKDVQIATSSFLDEAFAKLVFYFDPDTLKGKLRFIEINSMIMPKPDRVFKVRKGQRANTGQLKL